VHRHVLRRERLPAAQQVGRTHPLQRPGELPQRVARRVQVDATAVLCGILVILPRQAYPQEIPISAIV
jgi:hypothetical protein